jgi:hypothetical protein
LLSFHTTSLYSLHEQNNFDSIWAHFSPPATGFVKRIQKQVIFELVLLDNGTDSGTSAQVDKN